MKTSVAFLKVVSNAEKLRKIANLIQDILRQGKKILIIVPNEQAADYLDQYLWQITEESFIPHCIANAETEENAVITTLQKNLNGAKILLNLTANVPSFFQTFEMIYELDDSTSSEKIKLSKERQLSYQSSSAILSFIP